MSSPIITLIKQHIEEFQAQKDNNNSITSISIDEEQEQVDVTVSNSFTFTLTPPENYPQEETSYFCDENGECGNVSGNFEEICEKLIQITSSFSTTGNNRNNNVIGGNGVLDNDDEDDDGNGEYIFGSQSSDDGGGGGGRSGGGSNNHRNEDLLLNPNLLKERINLILSAPFSSFSEHAQSLLRSAYLLNEELCSDVANVFRTSFPCSVNSIETVALGVRVVLAFSVKDILSSISCNAYGVYDRELPIEIQLYFKRKHDYIKSETVPEVTVFQTIDIAPTVVARSSSSSVNQDAAATVAGSPSSSISMPTLKERKPFRFGTQLKTMLDCYLHEHWDRNEGFKYPTMATTKSQPEQQNNNTNTETSNSSEEDTNNNSSSSMIQFSKSAFHEQLERTKADKFVQYNPLEGFLCHILRWIRHRIPTCVKFCIICDRVHRGISSNILKPSVCERPLCVYQFQNLQMGKDAGGQNSVATGTGILDLLVGFFRAAVFTADTTRREAVLDPYPMVVDENQKLILDPQNKDFKYLEQLTKELPSSKELASVDDVSKLDLLFKKKNPHCLPLLQWIISSNRSFFTKIPRSSPPNPINKFIHTPHLFLLLTASEEKQRKFEELKKKEIENLRKNSVPGSLSDVYTATTDENNNNNSAAEGDSTTTTSTTPEQEEAIRKNLNFHATAFGFHGSGTKNWHAILRNGLKVMSGTSLMSSGAAFGNAMYFGYDLGTSLRYSRGTNHGSYGAIVNNANKTSNSNNNNTVVSYFDSSENTENAFFCVALCEVIKSKIKNNGYCFTISDEDAVLTKFLFVYQNENDARKDETVRVDFLPFKKAVLDLIEQTSK